MRKLNLNEWASIGELIGTAAVIVSLLFVAYSLSQNTDAIHGTTENILFERIAELHAQVIQDASLAEIIVKKSNATKLSDIEAVRWDRYEQSLLDIWALAYTRHQSELLSDRHFSAWDGYFVHLFSNGAERISHERWQELEYGFDPGFWLHVRDALFED